MQADPELSFASEGAAEALLETAQAGVDGGIECAALKQLWEEVDGLPAGKVRK